MNYLAIKEEKGKGVYQYATKEEKKKILKSLGLGQKAGKFFDSKEEALIFAGVKEVANRPQQVVDNCYKSKVVRNNNTINKEKNRESNSILKMLDRCREKGFDFAVVTLSTGKSFTIVLRDFYYLSTNRMISDTVEICSYYKGGKYVYKHHLDCRYAGASTVYKDMSSFDDYMKELSIRMNKNLKRIEECGSSSSEKVRITLKDAIEFANELVKINVNESRRSYSYLKATKIESEGNILFFDKISTKYIRNHTEDYLGSLYFDYMDKLDSMFVTDYILNTDYVVDIRPSKSKWKITDDKFLGVIKELEEEKEGN